MNARESLDLALKRLNIAVEMLEAAQSRRAQTDAARANLDEEYAIMQDDRTRLAIELDAAVAHNNALATTNAEVARRLESAGAAVRSVLASLGFDEAAT
jgi:hypothetical protein